MAVRWIGAVQPGGRWIGAVPGATGSTASGAGTAAGAASASGAGASSASAAGSASGGATATGSGAAIVAAAGTATGLATASGVGSSAATGQGAGSATGLATASAVGASLVAAGGTATGAATASGVGASTAAASGSATGLAAASGAGSSSSLAPSASGAGSALGVATALAVGASTVAAAGSAAGVATAVGIAPNGVTAGTLDQAIGDRLKAGVPGLAGVYLQEVAGKHPDGSPVAYPYAILNALNETPEWNTEGVSYPANATYQIAFISPTDSTARALRDQAYTLFTPRRNPDGSPANPPLAFGDGTLPPFGSLPGMKKQWKRGTKAAYGLGEWLYGFDVTFYVTRAM